MGSRKKQKDPRRHHYIPASYLANFTNDGTEKSQLWVFDQNTGNQWQSRPKGIAYENDFHTVETVDGPDSKTFEAAFALVESKTKPIINKICDTLSVPEKGTEEYNWLINYIALLCERTPARRKHFNESMTELSRLVARVGIHNKDYYESVMKEEKETGVSYDKLKEFIDSDDYDIEFHNNFHMQNLMTALDAILEPLGQRNWSVVYSPPMLGDFICSDNPVCLRFVNNVGGPFNSPGHGLLNTEVSVPLSPRVALLGRFEKIHPPSATVPSRKTVAIINSFTGIYADKFIFSKKSDFLWYDSEGNVCTIEDYKRLIKT